MVVFRVAKVHCFCREHERASARMFDGPVQVVANNRVVDPTQVFTQLVCSPLEWIQQHFCSYATTAITVDLNRHHACLGCFTFDGRVNVKLSFNFADDVCAIDFLNFTGCEVF